VSTPPRQGSGGATRLLATLTIGLGLAMIVRTVVAGGGPLAVGLILGVLFVAVGVGRLYLLARPR